MTYRVLGTHRCTVHGQMSFSPWLPEHWQAIHFRLRWRGDRLRVTVDHAGVTIELDGPEATTVPVLVRGRPVELTPGTTTVPLESVPDPSPLAGG